LEQPRVTIFIFFFPTDLVLIKCINNLYFVMIDITRLQIYEIKNKWNNSVKFL
jgi:hypothetical protein